MQVPKALSSFLMLLLKAACDAAFWSPVSYAVSSGTGLRCCAVQPYFTNEEPEALGFQQLVKDHLATKWCG